MQLTEHYIRRLLFDYDCVILPGFGGFIMHSQPAVIHPMRHRFYPPARIVSFNSLLKSDDGLLINAISAGEKISFESARAEVEKYVRTCHSTLKNSKTVNIGMVGNISSDSSGILNFEPDLSQNFLPISFGLGTFIVSPIKRLESMKRLEKKLVNRIPAAKHEPIPRPVKATILFALPLAAFLLWGIIFPQDVRDVYSTASNLVTELFSKPAADVIITAGSKITTFEVREEINPAAGIASSNTNTLNPEPANPEPVRVSLPDSDPNNLFFKILEPNNGMQKYYIIGGAFLNIENARKFVRELTVKGFMPEIPGTTHSGQYRVSYRSFINKPEALFTLDSIRRQENPSAWILKY
jgi:hypothetical protein